MANINYKIDGYNCFNQEINIPLFNAALSLAMATSKKESAGKQYREIVGRVIWGNYCNHENFLEPYTLRYLGEVLERFEEKFGTERKHFRAVALALGYALSFSDETMFIGQQKEAFLSKVKKAAADDLYLSGAWYLCQHQKDQILQLSETKFSKTEEVLFVLSLFENKDKGFETLWPELVRWWGSDRTLPVVGNISILAWFIENYRGQILGCRKRENKILRALTKIPTMYVKESSPVYGVLSEHGFSKKEIVYTNSQLILNKQMTEHLSYNSIPAEKAATEFCITYLNDFEHHDDELYDYIHRLFTLYRKFEVKYQGYQGIWEAVEGRLNPIEPNTALWLSKNVDKYDHYTFDIFDPAWDILARGLDTEKYWNIFTKQLLDKRGSLSAEVAEKWLEKYKQLTGLDYIEQFKKYQPLGDESFALLVEVGVIDPWEYFQKNVEPYDGDQDKSSYCESYLTHYVQEVKTRKAFLFWKSWLEKYTFADVSKFFGHWFIFHKKFYQGRSSYGYGLSDTALNFKREFLLPDEEKILFDWITESIYLTEPEIITSFMIAVLKDDYTYELLGLEQLRPLFFEMMESGSIKVYDLQNLKQRYLSEEELCADRIRQEAEEKKRKELQEQEAQKQKEKQLTEKFDGTFESLDDFIRHFFVNREMQKAAVLSLKKIDCVWDYNSGRISKKEVCKLYTLCGRFVALGLMTIEESIDQINRIVEVLEED